MNGLRSRSWRRDAIATILIWLSGLTAGGIVYSSGSDLRVAHPALLLPACGGLMWPARNKSVQQVQGVVFLYLMWLAVAACFDLFWRLAGPAGSSLHVSATLPIVVLIGAGWMLRQRGPGSLAPSSPLSGKPLLAAVVLLGLHMLFLAVLLRSIYGFGWEQDGAVLGRVGLCVVVVCGLGPPAQLFAFRASLSLMMALVLVARSLP